MISIIAFIIYVDASLAIDICQVQNHQSKFEADNGEIAMYYYDRPVVVFDELHKPHLGYMHKSLHTHEIFQRYVLIPPFYQTMHICIKDKVLANGFTLWMDLTTYNIGDFADEMIFNYNKVK